MKHVSVSSSVVCLALSALTACSGQSHDPSGAPAAAVELSLEAAPADARCLRVSFDGSRDVTRLLELTPGQAASFTLDRLPAGLVNVDAQAFSLACKNVAARSAPSYTSTTALSRSPCCSCRGTRTAIWLTAHWQRAASSMASRRACPI